MIDVLGVVNTAAELKRGGLKLNLRRDPAFLARGTNCVYFISP